MSLRDLTLSFAASMDITYDGEWWVPSRILRALIAHGWNARDGGRISYSLEIGEWLDAPLERLDDVLAALDDTWLRGSEVTLVLLWQESECGGTFLFFQKAAFSLLANLNRRSLGGGRYAPTDTPWYEERVLPALHAVRLPGMFVKWHEDD